MSIPCDRFARRNGRSYSGGYRKGERLRKWAPLILVVELLWPLVMSRKQGYNSLGHRLMNDFVTPE